MFGLLYFFIFILGTIIGSFINVLVFRYNSGVSINGRSFCPSCSKKLSWYELVPVLSFFAQKRRCRGCKSKISWQYPLVEIATGFIFIAVAYNFLFLGDWYGVFDFNSLMLPLLSYYWLIFSILIAITVYDLKHKIIPDGLVFLFIVLSFLGIFFNFETITIATPSLMKLLIGPILAVPIFLLWFISRGEWIGLGDAKLILGIGWMMGPSLGVSSVVLAFWIGAIFSLILLALAKINKIKKKFGLKSEIPFAPFLVLATFVIFIFKWNLLDFTSLFLKY